jgi:hypothetical protein
MLCPRTCPGTATANAIAALASARLMRVVMANVM